MEEERYAHKPVFNIQKERLRLEELNDDALSRGLITVDQYIGQIVAINAPTIQELEEMRESAKIMVEMQNKIQEKQGHFERSMPGNGIPKGQVKCLTCNTLLPAGIIPMANHDAKCGGKEDYDKMEAISTRYRKGEITIEEWQNQIIDLYQIDIDADARQRMVVWNTNQKLKDL